MPDQQTINTIRQLIARAMAEGVPTLDEVLTLDSDGGGNGISNITAVSFTGGMTNFLYMHSPDGTPWIVTIANDGTLSVVEDS